MIIKLIIPYFGVFPDHMDLFLESCSYNEEFNFLLITDQKKPQNLPHNVIYIYMSFSDVQKLFHKKLGKHAILYSPYKLCDYKPIYGFVFSDYLEDADYWGHCDVDLVFGRLMNFYTENVFGVYEKIQTQGHLIFYKNSVRMNEMFKNSISIGIMADEMMKTKEPCFYDEIMFPALCRANGVSFYECRKFADILPQYSTFVLSNAECDLVNMPDQHFYWEKGYLFRTYTNSQGIKEKEGIMYIHLQKRPLSVHYKRGDFSNKIYFTPQGIYSEQDMSDKTEYGNIEHVKKYKRKRWAGLSIKKVIIHFKVYMLRKSGR